MVTISTDWFGGYIDAFIAHDDSPNNISNSHFFSISFTWIQMHYFFKCKILCVCWLNEWLLWNNRWILFNSMRIEKLCNSLRVEHKKKQHLSLNTCELFIKKINQFLLKWHFYLNSALNALRDIWIKIIVIIVKINVTRSDGYSSIHSIAI